MSGGDEFAAELLSLPPGTNKFLAAADVLELAFLPPPTEPWLNQLMLAFAIFYTLLLILAVMVLVAIALWNDGGLWFVRVRSDGVWLLHTRAWYTSLSAAFCALNCVALVWQVLVQSRRATNKNWILFEGLKWIPLFLSAQIFCHGVAVARADASNSGVIVGTATAEDQTRRIRRLRRRQLVKTALNYSLLVLPAIVIIPEVVVFFTANAAYNGLYDAFSDITTNLRMEAARREPWSFVKLERLSTLLEPAAHLESPARRFLILTHVGWALWAGYGGMLSVLFAPFFWHHLRLLRELIGAPSLLAAFKCCAWRHPRHFPPDVEAEDQWGDRAQGGGGEGESSRPMMNARSERGRRDTGTRWSVSSIGGSAGAPSSAVVYPPPDGQPVRSVPMATAATRQSYVSLCWSALAAYSVMIGYIPLAIWAAQGDLKDPALSYAGVVWGSGLYGICGLVLNGCFFWRAVTSRPPKHARPSGASAAGNGPFGILRRVGSKTKPPRALPNGQTEAEAGARTGMGVGVGGRRRGLSATPDGLLPPAIWIETRTEVHREVERDEFWRFDPAGAFPSSTAAFGPTTGGFGKILDEPGDEAAMGRPSALGGLTREGCASAASDRAAEDERWDLAVGIRGDVEEDEEGRPPTRTGAAVTAATNRMAEIPMRPLRALRKCGSWPLGARRHDGDGRA